MRVSKLEYQKRDSNRVNLYIDGKFFCGISLDTLAKESLYEGLEIEDTVLNHILVEELSLRFWIRVLEYISRSPKSEYQIVKYLKELKFKKKGIWYKEDLDIDWDSLISNIVERLKKYKYIEDESFARMFVQSRMRSKPRGKSVLIGELLSKGISKDIAQLVCEQEVVDEYSLLRDVFKKKYKGRLFDERDSKMVNFLLRKGFSWDLIQRLKEDDFKE